MDYLLHSLLIGAGATALLDLWSLARHRLAHVAPPDYGLVGRWFAYMPRGIFRHDAIGKAPAVRGERLIGWTAHYLIGIAYAGVLLAIWGVEWVREPTLGPAAIVGIGSVLAPYLLMQPGMGAGIAASRTPQPGAARVRSLMAHAVFGVGLYLAGLASRFAGLYLA
jgi:hypothetical protein